jgi:hypothetical protein
MCKNIFISSIRLLVDAREHIEKNTDAHTKKYDAFFRTRIVASDRLFSPACFSAEKCTRKIRSKKWIRRM